MKVAISRSISAPASTAQRLPIYASEFTASARAFAGDRQLRRLTSLTRKGEATILAAA
jgi:hypothetical protein